MVLGETKEHNRHMRHLLIREVITQYIIVMLAQAAVVAQVAVVLLVLL